MSVKVRRTTDDADTSARESRDPEELRKFAAMADEWWDPEGKFRPLHRLNPVRLGYIRDRGCDHFDRDSKVLRPFTGLRLVDIGCGGGLVAEPMARLGANVVAIDAVPRNIDVARLHAHRTGLEIDYRCATAEELAAQDEHFDIVLALEIVEHVAVPDDFLATCAELLNPRGMIVLSTINRTPKAFALAIVGAEYVLRWLPRGTHDWRKFVRPSELTRGLAGGGVTTTDLTGVVLDPLSGAWRLHRHDLAVNYMAVGQKTD